MSACLWNDIDTALTNAITADMTDDGDYEDLLIQTILLGETVNPDQHTLPLVLIRGMEAQYSEDGPHGDGEIHIDTITYPYDLIAIARIEPTANETVTSVTGRAKAAATELLRRLRECVRSRVTLGITAPSTDGEHLDYVRFASSRYSSGNAMVQIQGYGGVNGGYMATAMLPIEVIASI